MTSFYAHMRLMRALLDVRDLLRGMLTPIVCRREGRTHLAGYIDRETIFA